MKPSKLKPAQRVISWVLQLVIITILGYASYLKLSDHAAEIDLFSKLGMEPAGRFIIGFIEAAACVLLLLPNAAVHGAILTFGVMLGALIGHSTKIGFVGMTPLAALLLIIISTVVIYLRRKQIPSIARMLN